MSNPIVTIEMENGGVIRAELYPEVAPNTVRNFVSLAQKGFYDHVIRNDEDLANVRQYIRNNPLKWIQDKD